MNANDNDNNMVTASRSCSRCGSINSTKSAIVVPSNQLNDEQEFEGAIKVSTPSLRYKRCASNLSDEEDRPHFCNSGETLSRRSSVSHLTHEVMSSFGSYTSLSFRSTPGNGEGTTHRNNRHSPRQHAHNHYHHKHHNHHYHGQNSSRKHQVYYQTHHALCKRAFSGGSHGSSESSANNPNRKHMRGSHRRKSSSSSFGGDSLRRRKRIDTESSSLHGSGLSLFEPLQVDVSTPSTNTVILTPSKITIEHSSDYEGTHEMKPSANGRTMVKRNRYISSPVQWTYRHTEDDANVTNDRMDFIEIVSEPEELCRSHSSKAPALPIKSGKRANNGIETPKKPSQYDDTNTFSIWEMAKENNEQTIIFHHKSDVGDKCCDNYCPRTESDTDMEINADRSYTTKFTDDDTDGTLKSNQNCSTSMSSLAHLEQLNNSMPSSNGAGNNTAIALANFQKNNISQTGSNRFLDLSSDIRRYSKITNFEQQNASNLLPNYLSRSSNANLNEPPPPPQPPTTTSFELFNIPSTSMYDKPFGSINLTTQNHFEPQSSSGIGSQRQQANNFNTNIDSYSHSNVRTENSTSNNNQLEMWTDGDIQQQFELTNSVQRSNRLDGNQPVTSIDSNSINSPTDHQPASSSYLLAPITTPQSTTNNATRIADNRRHSNNNNNLPIILNNNSDNNDNINFGTATRFRTKFNKFKKFFSKN